jgi:uncharacterized LabA/DUF88 family protein
MFIAKTKKIEKIAVEKQNVIAELQNILEGNIAMYIDFANIRPWSEKLNWHFDIKRLKQFLDSFDNILDIRFYQGLLEGDKTSENEISEIQKRGYTLVTKSVKIMKIPIDISSISMDSTAVLNNFIRKALLRRLSVETIEFLNNKIKKMNNEGELYIEDRKCNFDVELGIDMLLDFERKNIDTFVLWSGDSDFADPVEKLLNAGKKVIVFGTARRVSKELSTLRDKGLIIFDVKKIAKFVCWNKQINTLR